jgi:hypothetical protein
MCLRTHTELSLHNAAVDALRGRNTTHLSISSERLIPISCYRAGD